LIAVSATHGGLRYRRRYALALEGWTPGGHGLAPPPITYKNPAENLYDPKSPTTPVEQRGGSAHIVYGP
jgi:hypothetical protein